MKFFTKSLLTLALLVAGVTGVSAEKVNADLSKLSSIDGANATWDASTNTITWTAMSYNCITNFDLPTGDLSSWEKIVVNVTSLDNAVGVRIQIHFSDGTEPAKDFKGTGVISMNLSEFGVEGKTVEWIRMLGSGWSSGESHTISADTPASAVISEVYLERPDDPYLVPRDNLKKAINNAKNYSPYGKTESSVEALEEAVKAAEEELKVGDSQYESISAGVAKINAAKDAIDAAIAGLELKWGYFNLTKEMFNNPNCTYDLHKEATDCAYGNGGVGAADYADLSNYDQLIISVASGAARVYYNFDGAEYKPLINVATGETKVIDIPADANDYFHLNAIKAGSWGAKVVISEALAYIDFDNMDANEAVKANRQMLKDAIDQANAVDLENVTSESAAAMKEALDAAMALIFKRGDITMVPTMDAARRNLLEAIENLVEAYKFDASFYHNWSEVSATAEDKGVAASGGVKLNEDVAAGGAFWGNLSGAVPYLDYANITDYSELRFEGTPGAQLRLMCNRLVDEGPIFEKIYTIGSDGRLTVKISDLKFLNGGTPCDFVCLQAIKVPWGGSTCKLTSIQILKGGADEPVVTGLQTVKAAAENGTIFNLGGQRLAKPVKGLNIINGKKVVIK